MRALALLAALALWPALASAQTTISQLPAATQPLSGTEAVPIVQSGVTKQAPVSAISAQSFNPHKPGPIGDTTASTGAFSAITGPLTGTVGATSPTTGVFTSLQSSSGALNATVGQTTANLGTFSTLVGNSTATGASSARSLAAHFADHLSVKDFGAKCDGSTDDTAAIQAALNVGGQISFPAGTCNYTTLTVTTSARLTGAVASSGTGGTFLVSTDATTANKITIGTGAAQQDAVWIEHLTLNAPSATGGAVVFYNWVADSGMSDVQMLSVGSSAYGVLGNHLNEIHFDFTRFVNPITAGFRFYGDDTHRSDVIQMNRVIVSGDSTGAHTHIPTGIDIDGFVNTVDINQYYCVACGRGIWARNTVGATIRGEFIISHDTEIDFPYNEAIRVDYHDGLFFTNTYMHGSVTAQNLYINTSSPNSITNISFIGGQCTGAFKACMYLDGNYTRIAGMLVTDNSLAGSGTYPAIEVGPDSIAVSIQSSQIGQESGYVGPTQSYGVQLDLGAAEWIVANNDLTGNLTAPINNLSGIEANSSAALASSNLGFGALPGSQAVIVPVTGFVTTVGPGGGNVNVQHIEYVPAGTLATGTINLPAVPYSGQMLAVYTTQTITALTVTPNSGQTMDVPITTLATNTAFTIQFQQATGSAMGTGRWTRVQ